MRIVNNYDIRGVFDLKLKVFWRAFEAWDDGHVLGLKEGVLGHGESVSFEDREFFQIEFRRENLAGAVLAGAGPIYSRHGGDVVLHADGATVLQSAPAWNHKKGPYTEWMNNDRIQNKTLFDITVPHTHDSAACALGPRLYSDSVSSDVPADVARAFQVGKTWAKSVADLAELIVRPICQTQSRPIDQQLNDGIRGLDLRVVMINHGLNSGHGLVANPISVILEQVKQFLETTHRELVILSLGVGSSTNDFGKHILNMLVQKTLGDRLVPPTIDLQKTKIGDITNGKSRVIVTGPGFRSYGDLSGSNFSWWANTDDPAELERKVVKAVKEHQKPGVWVNPGWTLTAQFARMKPVEDIGKRMLETTKDLPDPLKHAEAFAKLVNDFQALQKQFFTILPQVCVNELAAKVNPRMKDVFENELRDDRINALSADFYENTPLVELAVARSLR